jgi:sRNA-binding carbon storage regulator CsrA
MKSGDKRGTLCISLREGEVFTIGEDILVMYGKAMSAKQIKIIIKAPKDVKIGRIKKEDSE